MRVKQNYDTSYSVCNAFWTVIDSVVTKVDGAYDKRKKPGGFEWESDVDILNGYYAA